MTVGTQWSGYGFTAADNGKDTTCTPATGSSVSPTCTTTGCTPAFDGSFSGTVAACTDYGGFAMIGWNVNGATGTWPLPSSGGITVTFTNPTSAPTRIQVQDASGNAYCAPLTSGTAVPWSSFESKCWTTLDAGAAPIPAGTLIQQAMVEVVGNATTAVKYDICVESISIQ